MKRSEMGLTASVQRHGSKYHLLTFLDYLFTSLVVCPCVVGYWRSVWGIMVIYVYPEDEWLSAMISTAIGLAGHIFFSLSQNVFRDNFHPRKNRMLFFAISRSYTLCFGFVCVNGWRGPWQLLDIHAKKNVFAVLATTMVGVVALISIRSLRNATASPFVVVNDRAKGYFEITTMFRVPLDKFTGLYVLDCLFSILIVGILVVFIWRGCWGMVDIFLFPDNAKLSAWASLIIGYLTVILTFLIQPGAKYFCETAIGTPRLLVADCLHLFALFSTVNVWRGIWNLLDFYFLPDNPALSCWIVHWVSFVVLVAVGCSNTILVRGVLIDAEEPEGECADFPIYLLRDFFLKRKSKRLKCINPKENFKFSNMNEKSMDTVNTISVLHKPSLENSINLC